ncbi:MAG TPA: hypothetical protein VF042_16500 [Gemmatimonadaceae bacterium]
MNYEKPRLRALCVGRHPFLSDHFARFFANLGIETSQATGLDEALVVSRICSPEVVICEYEVLATLSLEGWEHDSLLSRTPVIAVSLTRRPQEAHLLDVNGIGGFLYLPMLDRAAAVRIIRAAALGTRVQYIPAPMSTTTIEAAEPAL